MLCAFEWRWPNNNNNNNTSAVVLSKWIVMLGYVGHIRSIFALASEGLSSVRAGSVYAQGDHWLLLGFSFSFGEMHIVYLQKGHDRPYM